MRPRDWSGQKADSPHGAPQGVGPHREEFSNPGTSQLSKQLRTGLREIWDEANDELNADAASCRAPIELKGLTSAGASREGWGEVLTQLPDWLISNSKELGGVRWGFMRDVPGKIERRRLPFKLRLAGAANYSRGAFCPNRS